MILYFPTMLMVPGRTAKKGRGLEVTESVLFVVPWLWNMTIMEISIVSNVRANDE